MVTVSGKISWFGGPHDPSSGPTTASGASVDVPGIAIYRHDTLGRKWSITLPNGRRVILPQTDYGPAPWTGRVIDFTYSALPLCGYSEASFPTDAEATAVLVEDTVTERLVIDYAWTHPDPSRIKQYGYEGVVRYLSKDPSKDIGAAERDALRASGLSIALVWETTANRAGQGRDAGITDAREANARADALGYPRECVIFYATDYDATVQAVTPYYQGVHDAGGRPAGVYAGLAVCESMMTLVPYGWQTVAWSGGKVSDKAHLYQRLHPTKPLGGDYDENIVLHEYPAWRVGSSPLPPQAPLTKEVQLKLIQVKGKPEVYLVVGAFRVHIPNPTIFNAQFKSGDINFVTADHVLMKLPEWKP